MEHNNVIAISAFSGLAGALLTQLMTGVFSYYSDKRKNSIEVKNAFRNKKIEIGENFYYLNGETMALLKKSIDYWLKRSRLTADNIEFVGKEVKHTEELIAKAYAKNWKYNLVNLYFDVKLSISEINEENIKSHSLFIQIREIAERIKNEPNDDERERLYGEYSFKTLDLISQYEHVYQLLQQDMDVVKRELLKEFG